jgi:hypothetical protein
MCVDYCILHSMLLDHDGLDNSILFEHIQLAQGRVSLSFRYKLLIFIIKKCLARSFRNLISINSNMRKMNV